MKVIYAGYRSWSYKILENLLKKRTSWKIQNIITVPEAEAPFQKLKIPTSVLSPEELKSETFTNLIKKQNPDVILFYGWSWIIPKEIYENYLCLVLHTSPLPKYRGGSPLQHQIIQGEKESAVTILRAVEKIDQGPIFSQSSFALSGSLNDIFKRIVKIGTKNTIEVLNNIKDKTIVGEPQDESKKTYYKRRKASESEIKIEDFKNKTARQLYDFIRALTDPYPNAYFVCKDGKKIYFTGVKIEDEEK